VGSSDGGLYALDRSSGEVMLAFRAGDRVWTLPAVVDGVIYFGSHDGHIYVISSNQATGFFGYMSCGYLLEIRVPRPGKGDRGARLFLIRPGPPPTSGIAAPDRQAGRMSHLGGGG
jgi:hypothetical protein